MPESRRSFLRKIATGTSLSSGGVAIFARSLCEVPTSGLAEGRLSEENASLPAKASATTLWQIGRFNSSSGEFNCGVDPVTDQLTIDYMDRSQDPVYSPGKSDPSKHWFAFQPGSRNRQAGYRPHPFTVEFSLPDVPKGLYTLKVAVLVEHPCVSRLQVEIEGHVGRFYFHPKLNYAMGDLANSNFPEYSSDTIAIELPTHFLRKGANKLVLTAVDEVDAQDSQGQPPRGLNSGLVYDALLLDHDPSREFEETKIDVLAVPTVFYKMQEGRLHELIDVFVRVNQPVPAGELTLTLGEWKSAQNFGSERAFGEYRMEFSVPEFTSPARGEVSVVANALSKHVPVDFTPAKKWNLFVVPHVHLDMGFTDYQSKVAGVQCRNIDKALDIMQTRPEFLLSLDGTWIVEQFLQSRSDEQRQRFATAVRENRISIPAQYMNLLTGFPTLETLIRSLYAGKEFLSQLGGTFDYANITDVPSYSWSYASILAAAGLKYFVAASNNHDAPILLLGRLHEKSPFWWEGPDGGRILMWYSRHYSQAGSLFGMPPQIESGRDSLPVFLQIYTRPEYKSDAVIVFGTQGDNQDLIPEQAELVESWNSIYAYPKLHFSSFSQAMQYIAQQAGDSIPTFRGDGAPYWEEGIPSDAYYAALNRQNEPRALSAEKAATISSLVDPHIRPDRVALTRMWENLLMFDEHTWTDALCVGDPESQETVGQLTVKDSRALEAQRGLEHVLGMSMQGIANRIPFPSGTLIVFNFLSWSRSGLVEMDLRDGSEIIDLATDQEVPYELLGTTRTYKRIRFLALDVPGTGYRCYKLARDNKAPRVGGIPPTGWGYWQGPGPSIQSSGRLPGGPEAVLESPYYRVALDSASGAVKSIFDKELNKELVDATSPFRFDQYLYVTGADKVPNRLIRFPNGAPPPKLEAHGAKGGQIISVTKPPFGTVALVTSSAINTPRITTEIVLFDHKKKIQFTNRVNKTKVYTREAVYFAFPFAMDHPQFLYEIQNGFVNPAKDQLPGAGKEWFSVQHWVAVRQGGVTAAIVPVHVPLVALGDFVHGTWAESFGARKGTIFSFVMNNYWEDNYVAAQGGDFSFRYVLTSNATLAPDQLSRLGWEETTPLEVNAIVSQDKEASLPQSPRSSTGSFVEVNPPNVFLINWKMAEDGKGSILRFLEAAGRAETATVRIPLLEIESAWMCNAVEQNEQPLSASSHEFTFSVKPFQVATVRIEANSLQA